MNYYFKVLQNYFNFTERARRSEYWYFFLINSIISIALHFIGNLLKFEFLNEIYAILVLIPSLAVAVRRVHDVGKSGFYLLIPFYNLVLLLIEGDSGPNKYGDDPKSESSDQLEEIYYILMSFLISSLTACSFYALLNETKIFDEQTNAEPIKDIVFIVAFLISFILSLTKTLSNIKDS